MYPFEFATYIDKSLSKNEKVISKFELSNILYIIPFFYGIILLISLNISIHILYNIGIINLADILKYFNIILIIIAIYKLIYLRTIEYSITNSRVVCKKGIISIKSEEILIDAIETVEIDQSILGRIFNYGFIIITGRGNSKLIFEYVKDPIKVKTIIEDVIEERRNK